MKAYVRGIAAMLLTAALSTSVAAQEKTMLSTEREKVSYAIGMDVGSSIRPVGPDLDLAAFEASVRNAFAGKEPVLTKQDAMATDAALRARIAAREGKPVEGQAPGAPPPAVSKEKVGQMLGSYMVGPSLAPIQAEIDLPVLVQGVRTTISGGKPLLSEAEAKTVLTAFTGRLQASRQAAATAAAGKNAAEGAAFLAKNKAVTGVHTTPTGLQYMVLRQGAGVRPTREDRVRVNYEGTLLDGTVFDSSYKNGQPIEFALNQVIPGWTEGLGLMPVGAKYRFWIPSQLGYGEKGTPGGPIGPNATLVFDVELLGIVQ